MQRYSIKVKTLVIGLEKKKMETLDVTVISHTNTKHA